jgi:hypothetical protein
VTDLKSSGRQPSWVKARSLRYRRGIFSGGFEPKGLAESTRLAFPRFVVDVAGGSSGVGVAHPVLELANALGLGDGERPEGVSEKRTASSQPSQIAPASTGATALPCRRSWVRVPSSALSSSQEGEPPKGGSRRVLSWPPKPKNSGLHPANRAGVLRRGLLSIRLADVERKLLWKRWKLWTTRPCSSRLAGCPGFARHRRSMVRGPTRPSFPEQAPGPRRSWPAPA